MKKKKIAKLLFLLRLVETYEYGPMNVGKKKKEREKKKEKNIISFSSHCSVRYFDVIILIPNVIFLGFLLFKWYSTRNKLNSSKPLLLTVWWLIILVSLVNIIRCLYAMIFTDRSSVILKVLWLIVRFALLCTELSLVFFGIYFGKRTKKINIEFYDLLLCFLRSIESTSTMVKINKNSHYFIVLFFNLYNYSSCSRISR